MLQLRVLILLLICNLTCILCGDLETVYLKGRLVRSVPIKDGANEPPKKIEANLESKSSQEKIPEISLENESGTKNDNKVKVETKSNSTEIKNNSKDGSVKKELNNNPKTVPKHINNKNDDKEIHRTVTTATDMESGTLFRGVLVVVVLTLLIMIYIGFQTYRKRNKRAVLVRKYGVRNRRSDMEMTPLPLDDDEEDETVFQVNR